MKEPGSGGGSGMAGHWPDRQALPFFGVPAAVASLALAVAFPLIKPLAFVVFVGIVGGLAAWGILGLFIGPPVMSLFLFLLENYRITRKSRDLPEESCGIGDMASSGAGVYDQEN